MNERAVKWLYAVPGKRKFCILVLMIVQALYGGSGVLYALLLRGIVDHAVDHDSEGFWLYVVLTAALVAGQITLWALIRWLSDYSKAAIENTFKERLMRNVLQKDFASVSAIHSGEWLNRLTNDTVVIAESYVDILPGLAGMTVKLVSAVVMMIVLDRTFALLLIPCGLLLLVLTSVFRKVLKKLHKNVQEKDGKLRIFWQERISSLMMIRSYAAEEQTMAGADTRMEDHKAARLKRTRFSIFCNVGFITSLNGLYLFGVCYCGYGILTGTISYGTLTAVTQLISQIQSPVANITGYLPKLYAMTASAERLMEIESFEDDCDTPAFSAEKIREYYAGSMQSFGLEDAEFTYYPAVESIKELTKENQPVVLQHISVEIRRGEYVAFTGHSGCGKSTVLKLLMSIYQLDAGERFLSDNDGKHPLTAEWRRLFAYVPQGNQLMSGTIRDVVSFADRSAKQDDERIRRALEIACADTFVGELENGIDTLLGERGTGLSEGQMQRIAIARAIFSDSPILLLDESTSALDAKTEKQVLENLRRMTDKTVVIVTHRPAALEICDRILGFSEDGVTERKP